MGNPNFNEVIGTCKEFMSTKLEMKNINEPLLNAVAEGLGSAIYNPDASLVACSDKGETARIKTNFLIGALKLADSKELDAAIAAICKQMGTSNRKKFRIVFYYLLLKHFRLENQFLTAETSGANSLTSTTETTPSVISNIIGELAVPEKEDAPLLASINNSLGSHAETSTVNIHDDEEKHRIREHFLRGRLGLHHHHHDELNAAIHTVHEKMGPDGEKNRAAFYYHLTKHFGAEQAILNPVPSNLF